MFYLCTLHALSNGNTLLQYTVYLIINDGVLKADGKTLQEMIPSLRRYTLNNMTAAAKTESRRLIKTHMPYGCLPAAVESGHGKVIYIGRNPKDLCVSMYHFLGISKYGESIRGEFPDFFERFKTGYLSRGPWIDHITAYWDHRCDKNILFLLFEDLLQHPERTVSKIAEFISHPLTEQQISHIVHKTRFDVMKEDPNVTFLHPSLKVPVPKEAKMRKGQIGDWVNFFTADMEKEINDIFIEPLKSRGLTFIEKLP